MKLRTIIIIAAGAAAAAGLAIAGWFLFLAPRPVIAYAPEPYMCEISVSGRTASFKLRFSFEAARSGENLVLSVESRPEISELWTVGAGDDAGGDNAVSLGKELGDAIDWDIVMPPEEGEVDGSRFDSSALGLISTKPLYDGLAGERSKLSYKNDVAIEALRAAFVECMSDALEIVGAAVSGDETTRVTRDGERTILTLEKTPWNGSENGSVDARTVLDSGGAVIDRVATGILGEWRGDYDSAEPPVRLAYRIYRSSAAADAIPPLAELPRQWYQRKSDTGSGFPRIDGSTATIPLSAALVSKLYGYPADTAKKLFRHNKTHDAYLNLINGNADLIFVTEPSKEELALAREKGVALVVQPVTREAFVFLVNAVNDIDSLTVDNLRDIYSGRMTYWEYYGIEYGANTRIVPLFREPNSGSQTLFEKFVMPTADIVIQPEYEIDGMGELIEDVADSSLVPAVEPLGEDDNDTPSAKYGAIGFSVYYYATQMRANPGIRLIAIDGVEPSDETILDGSYPFITGYYAVYRRNEVPKSVRDLLYWITFPVGADTLRKANYLPYTDVKK